MLSHLNVRFLPYYAVRCDANDVVTDENPDESSFIARKSPGCDIAAICHGRANGGEATAAVVQRHMRGVSFPLNFSLPRDLLIPSAVKCTRDASV